MYLRTKIGKNDQGAEEKISIVYHNQWHGETSGAKAKSAGARLS